ncbi:hypothetical protein PUNSTDRAFT_135281 [Punctularia strigosozonata HHB-11173 SS5]|uniref:uncharacterized protein n=1 Tax=Punctularia strigosozonata (strain HHB-11173) TaxID=741275 RepID=UPI0004418575|nr:uncharacterized protein PUNSTDRAFT_135281 [Punctularia strigosozonata HHB-11173 SS5]EIN07758.1 hypothetical protein PUNSTDRAFT_135281 [Punctularia strigosozonata HHB-11173 SS5]
MDNAFPPGTRVFFWDGSGTVKHGVVLATARLGDGTQVAQVQVEGETALVSLPTASLSKA